MLGGLSVLAMRAARRHPYLPVGWLWYVGTLVPVIGLVQVGSQAMADRYTYVPLIGILIFIGWGLAELGAAWALLRPVKLALAGLTLTALVVVTGSQLAYWRNGITLFEHAGQVTRANHVSHAAYGIALSAQGRSAEAIEQFPEALRLQPNYALAHVSL